MICNPDCYNCNLLTRYLEDFLEDGRAYNKMDPTFLRATGHWRPTDLIMPQRNTTTRPGHQLTNHTCRHRSDGTSGRRWPFFRHSKEVLFKPKHLSSDQNPGYLLYILDYRDYNTPWNKDPVINQSVFHVSCQPKVWTLTLRAICVFVEEIFFRGSLCPAKEIYHLRAMKNGPVVV